LTLNKELSEVAFVGRLRDGMTLGVGGWATRRKPMNLVRAIARSSLKDLTLVAPYGGPDVGLLAASGKIKKLVFAFVSLDHLPLDPHFRAGRQSGAFEVRELDEGLAQWSLRAGAMRLPFLPTRAGLGTDVPKETGMKTIRSPYDDGEELLAAPAIRVDATILHVHRADKLGNTLILSPDPFFDDLLARAADEVYVSTEKLVSTAELDLPANARFNPFERSVVTGVIHAPFGAHPTGATPDYGIDMDHLKTYAAATTPEAWADYRTRFIEVEPAAYLDAVGGGARVSAIPAPIY
jgi:glutaconate CoA-transferase subunit A